ncbi:MAG: hypothetical protein UV24_C0006G0020 [Candidatus Nomurabacteria bacterium GW2011_GWA2_42_41]|nr:MAG: hypothetical protein UV24_C0006G0020 [Candidatus Nomurabacteria bacterium GW2011_GWA2_42_41]
MENMTIMFLLFFIKAVGASAIIGYLVYLRTKSTMTGFFGGFALPLCIAVFLFLLPQVGVAVALLASVGVLFYVFVIFFLVNECSPWLRERLQNENKSSGDISPIWDQKRKEANDEHNRCHALDS